MSNETGERAMSTETENNNTLWSQLSDVAS